MNDDELRALIRAAVLKHVGAASGPALASPHEHPGALRREAPASMAFGQYQLERADTMCIIEPAVQCNHCGFCKCHGH